MNCCFPGFVWASSWAGLSLTWSTLIWEVGFPSSTLTATPGREFVKSWHENTSLKRSCVRVKLREAWSFLVDEVSELHSTDSGLVGCWRAFPVHSIGNVSNLPLVQSETSEFQNPLAMLPSRSRQGTNLRSPISLVSWFSQYSCSTLLPTDSYPHTTQRTSWPSQQQWKPPLSFVTTLCSLVRIQNTETVLNWLGISVELHWVMMREKKKPIKCL